MEKPNSILYYINKLADLVILSLLWAVCSLPIITMGASCAALSYSISKAIRQDEGVVVKAFLSAFKKSVKQSALLSLFFVPLTILSALGVMQYYQIESPNITLAIFALCLAALYSLIIIQFHLYSLIGRFQLNNKQLLSAVVLFSTRFFINNFLIMCTLAFFVWLVFSYPPLILIAPSTCTLLCSIQTDKPYGKLKL